MTYKHRFIKIQTVWFDDKIEVEPDVDVVVYRQVQKAFKNSEEFYTLLIDLSQTEDQIFESFSKSNRKEIRKSINNDNLIYKMHFKDIDDELIKSFLKAQNKFSKERDLGEWSFDQLKAYAEYNELYISTISTNDNTILSWRVHISSNKRARALVSNSFYHNGDKDFRNLIGRASRLMRWKDISYFKNHGFNIYDFGGWYNGSEDKKKLSINQYKESFSKEKDKSYNYTVNITWKSHLFNLLKNIKRLLK